MLSLSKWSLHNKWCYHCPSDNYITTDFVVVHWSTTSWTMLSMSKWPLHNGKCCRCLIDRWIIFTLSKKTITHQQLRRCRSSCRSLRAGPRPSMSWSRWDRAARRADGRPEQAAKWPPAWTIPDSKSVTMEAQTWLLCLPGQTRQLCLVDIMRKKSLIDETLVLGTCFYMHFILMR